jgi:predicted nuclease of restriction endonuclease-like (RecB) superfamily
LGYNPKLSHPIAPAMSKRLATFEGYEAFLRSLKERIRHAQMRAALAVNREMVIFYWQLGREILMRQKQQGWGAKVIDQLAKDLQKAFPEMKGFSPRNLKYMRSFAEAYSQEAIVQEVLAQLPWYHNIALLEKTKDNQERLWYAHEAIQYGWSRNVLVHHIESELFGRSGRAITNFDRVLPQPDSDLAQQMLKDPYNFSFLSLEKAAQERDLERALTDHIRQFLLELGVGFAFMGSQYHLVVDDDDYYIDLLFYHTRLHCYVVIDLKMASISLLSIVSCANRKISRRSASSSARARRKPLPNTPCGISTNRSASPPITWAPPSPMRCARACPP